MRHTLRELVTARRFTLRTSGRYSRTEARSPPLSVPPPEDAPVFEIAIVTALLLTAVIFALVSSRAIDRADTRDDVARHLFMAGFDGAGVPSTLLLEVFEALRRRVPPGVDVMRPADQLAMNYGFSQADAEDIVLLVAARAEGHIPKPADLDRLGDQVRTVADLVRFLVPFCAPQQQMFAQAS
jgi:hypothetical protein